ncbi:MAG: hypothetical protein IJ583_09430 [Firmicutes bacterium]|nr:hypothetical protein [Bacillota bacterium]
MIKQFFKDLGNTIAATIKPMLLFVVVMDIWSVLIYGFDIVRLIAVTLLFFAVLIAMYAVILLINTGKYGKVTRIENERGRYSDEYYQAVEEIAEKMNKPSKQLQRANILILLAAHYLEGGRVDNALETLRKIDNGQLVRIPDTQPVKSMYYCVLIGIMIKKGDISSAITVCEQNKKLFDKHITNLRYGAEINHILCIIEFFKGNYSGVLKEMEERVYKKDPIDKVSDYLLCYRCEMRLGDSVKADEYMRKAENELEKCKWFHKEIMTPKITALKENELEYKY